MTVLSEITEEAGEFIKAHGWTQNSYRNQNGQVCMAGALCYAVRERRYRNDLHVKDPLSEINSALVEAINTLHGTTIRTPSAPYYWGIEDWNDLPTTTEAMVLEVFDLAACRLAETDG